MSLCDTSRHRALAVKLINMRSRSILIFALALLCRNAQAQKSNSKLITETSWSGITKSTNYSGLIKIFGTSNIKDERICGAECVDSVDVTMVFPGSAKEIIVYWADSLYHKRIGFLVSDNEKSPYQTVKGVRIGSTLSQLLKLNGKKISFGGFGWDYGGGIMSFNKGSLDKSKFVYLLDYTGQEPEDALEGERSLDTNMPVVKKHLSQIKVVQITLVF